MKADAQREKIVRAARDLYARYGVRKTAVEEIAREAGISKATVYNHFSGKEQIAAGVLEFERRLLHGKVRRAVNSAPDPLAELRAFVRTRILETQRQHDFYRVGIEEVYRHLPLLARSVEQGRAGEEALLVEILRRGEKCGQIRPLRDRRFAARVLYTSVLTLAFPLFGPAVVRPGSRKIEELTDLVVHGVAAVPCRRGGPVPRTPRKEHSREG